MTKLSFEARELPVEGEAEKRSGMRLWSVEVAADEVRARVAAEIARIKPEVKIAGFRPGKVPDDTIKQRFGDRVAGGVAEGVASDVAESLVKEHALRPALTPQAELHTEARDLLAGDSPLKMTIRIEPSPEIEIPDLKTIALEEPVFAIEDEDVSRALADLVERNPRFSDEASDKQASAGDLIVFDFDGALDGKPFKGGKGRDAKMVLGRSGLMPAFEKVFMGRSAGFRDSVTAAFPEDHPEAHLAGREAVFDVELKAVRHPISEEADDRFAEHMGFSSLEELREKAREEIARADKIHARSSMKRQILEHLAKRYDFAPPPTLIAREFATLWQGFLAARGEDPNAPTAPNIPNIPNAQEREQRLRFLRVAEERVRVGLVLSEIGAARDVKVRPEDMRNAVLMRAAQFPGREKEILEFYQKSPRAAAALHAPIFEEKTIDLIIKEAKITEKPISREEARNLSAETKKDDEGKKGALVTP